MKKSLEKGRKKLIVIANFAILYKDFSYQENKKTKEEMIMKKMKENKGFTLVELIVVIVILAILAAILVPALLGYIDKAKSQQVVLNGKSVLTAAQAELSKEYAKGNTIAKLKASDPFKSEILNTADVPGDTIEIKVGVAPTGTTPTASQKHEEFTVRGVKYVQGNNTIYYYYDATSKTGEWTDSSTGYTGLTGETITIK